MDKILEKIYSEKDFRTNLSLIFGCLVGFIVYLLFINLILVLLSFIFVFALSKLIIDYFISKKEKISIIKKYSEDEIDVIKYFIINGSSFSRNNIYKDFLKKSAIDSHIARGNIIINPPILISGYCLDKDLYSKFLSFYKKDWESFNEENKRFIDKDFDKEQPLEYV